MNSNLEKIFESLQNYFWEHKIEFSSSDDYLKEILGSAESCPQNIRDFINKCVKLSTRPKTKADYQAELAALKGKLLGDAQETGRAAVTQETKRAEVVEESKMSVRPSNLGTINGTASLDPNEKDLIEYLQNDFWSQKGDYKSAHDLIEGKFYGIEPGCVDPEVLSFMDRTIKDQRSVGSESLYIKSLSDLLKKHTKILIPKTGTENQNNSNRLLSSQNQPKGETREKETHTTHSPEINSKSESKSSNNEYSKSANTKYPSSSFKDEDSHPSKMGDSQGGYSASSRYSTPFKGEYSQKAEEQKSSTKSNGTVEKAKTINDSSPPISVILDDAEFLIQHREIDIEKLKPLIFDFLNTLTGIELTMAYDGMSKYSPVEKIQVNDELGLWSYDHFQGCMNIGLKRSGGNLPKIFRIEKDFFRKNPKAVIFRNFTDYGGQQDKEQIKSAPVTLEAFLTDVAEVNKKDTSFIKKWLKALNEDHADKLEEILAWDEKDWDSAKLEVNATKLIRNHLNQFRFKSTQNDEMKNLTESERCAVTHRIKRFLIWKTKSKKDLENIEDLDESALTLGFQEIREKYIGESLLEQLQTFYESFTIPKAYSRSLITNRGMLLYGPPGTGKTVLTDILPSRIGLTPISYPLCASEVNRSLVGQTEKLLLELVSRAQKIPYLLCCLAVDEIDGLAPKRDGNSSQHKVDALAVLLSVIGGIKDVSNLMFLASTNRLNQMDDAFKRRMSGQFFVGRPSPLARKAIIESSEATHLTKKMVEQVVILSTNFSGAALKQYISYIVSEARKFHRTNNPKESKESKKSKECLSYNKLAEIAAQTSKQFNIRLGNYSLPELFLLQKQKENPFVTSFLKNLNDHQAILILKENLVEIVYRRFRTGKPTTLESTEPKEIVELEHFDIIIDKSMTDTKKLLENLLYSKQEGENNKQRIEVETFKLGITQLTETQMRSLIEEKVKEVLSKARKNKEKEFVLLWPEFIEKGNSDLRNKMISKCFQECLLSHSESSSEKLNLYNFFITSEENTKKLRQMLCWEEYGILDKNKIKFAGRILADLSEEDPELQFELSIEDTDTFRLHRESLLLESSVANSSKVIPKLVEFASERGIDFILLMDQDFLLANNAFDDTKIKESITEKMQEFNCYPKSLLIVDVDSLVGMVKSVSESSMGPSNSYSLSDSKLYSMIIHYARSIPKILPSSSSEYWVALISKNKELSKMIKSDLSWPMTIEEIRTREEEDKNQEPRDCLRCNETYTEEKNDFNNCSFHDGDLFESSAPPFSWKMIEQENAKKQLLKGTVISKYGVHEKDKQPKEPQFLHICCLQPLNSQGCKKRKHTCDKTTVEKEKTNQAEEYRIKLNECRTMLTSEKQKFGNI